MTLITDIKNFDKNDLNKYDNVKVLLYSTDRVFKKFEGVEFISCEHYYVDIYKEINRFVREKSKKNPIFIGLVKSLRYKLFDIFFVYLIYNLNRGAVLKTSYDGFLNDFGIKTYKKVFAYKTYLTFIYIFLKSFIGLLLSFKTVKKKDILFLDYPLKNVTKFYYCITNSSIKFDLDFSFALYKTRLSLKNFILSFRIYKEFINITKGFSFLRFYLYIAIIYTYRYSVLLSKYDPKFILGVFDSSLGSEFLYKFTKENNVKLMCLTHCSHLYDFNIEYLHNPFDYYAISSDFHKELIKKQIYLDSPCKFISIGHINYSDNSIEYYLAKDIKKEYDIVFIGDYYHDNLAINPFTKNLTNKIAKVLLKLSDSYKILVRPREKDKYYEDLCEVLKDKVDYSINDSTIYEDIKKSKIGIGAYSNGIRDGLLLNVPFVHIDFINLKTTFLTQVKDNHLYFAKNEEELCSLIDKFFSNKLEPLEFENNNEKYMYSAKFEPEKIINLIEKELS